MKPLYLETFRGRDRQHYFRFRASNGRVLLTSEGYRRRVPVVKFLERLTDAIGNGQLIVRKGRDHWLFLHEAGGEK